MAIPINPFAHIRVQDDDDDCEIADERCCDIADERQDVFLPDDLRNNQNGLNGVYEEKKYKKATDVDEAHEQPIRKPNTIPMKTRRSSLM